MAVVRPRLTLLLTLLTPLAAGAADDWRSCRRIADDGARLACYDRHADQAAAPASPADFGLPARPPAEAIDAIEARITRVDPLPHGRRLIHLDNGQRWRQVESRSHPSLKVGDQVRIRRASLGSFLLKREGSGATLRVKRVR